MNLSMAPPLEACARHKRLICPLEPGQSEQALSYYMGIGSLDINGILRDKRAEPTWGRSLAEVNAYIDALDKLIECAPRSKTPLRVYRGMIQKPWGFKQGISEKDYAGQHFRDPGFLSASARRNIATRFINERLESMLLEIILPVGTPLLWTNLMPKGMVNTGESEILLPRNSQLTITRCIGTKEGLFPSKDFLEIEATLCAPGQSAFSVPLQTRMRSRLLRR